MILFFLALMIFVLIGYKYLYYSYRDITSESPVYNASAKDIPNDFIKDIIKVNENSYTSQ